MGHCCIDSPENDNKLKSGQFLKIIMMQNKVFLLLLILIQEVDLSLGTISYQNNQNYMY